MLRLMGRAGCMLISWGIESGNEAILKKAHKGYKMDQALKALTWAKPAGIKNWGYFIIGLPGETVVENNWFRSGTNWEEVDMDQATVLDYENLKAEDLLKWQKRAFREWAFRPGPIWTMLKSMNTWQGLKSGVDSREFAL
jgi:anaerobic magnesium-protoporphyrin IX monomethyl ester cyclase